MAAHRFRALVDGVDDLAFVVRLHVLEVVAVVDRRRPGVPDHVVEGVGSVHRRVALPEQVQVRPREQENRRHLSITRSLRAGIPGSRPFAR